MDESVGTVYNCDLINKKLAESSFGFYVAGWWQIAHKYIEQERKRQGNDDDIYKEFQIFAEEMIKVNPNIKHDKFIKDESLLVSDS